MTSRVANLKNQELRKKPLVASDTVLGRKKQSYDTPLAIRSAHNRPNCKLVPSSSVSASSFVAILIVFYLPFLANFCKVFPFRFVSVILGSICYVVHGSVYMLTRGNVCRALLAS